MIHAQFCSQQQRALTAFCKEVGDGGGHVRTISTPRQRDGVIATDIVMEYPSGDQKAGTIGLNPNGGYWCCLTMTYDSAAFRWDYPHEWSCGVLN